MFLTNSDALGIDKIIQRGLNQLRQMVGYVLVAGVVQVVVVGILQHAFVKVCPSEYILLRVIRWCNSLRDKTYHSVLLIFNRLDGNLCEEVVMEEVRGQMGLDRQAFRQEFFIKVFPCLLTHENTATVVILSRAAGFTHHLKDIHDRVVNVAMFLAFVELYAHDNDHVAGDGKAPCGILMKKLQLYSRL